MRASPTPTTPPRPFHTRTHVRAHRGDSWRARASHVCELQAHLAAGALTIDFGGLDRWDYAERARNVAEAEAPVGAAVGL